MNPAASINEPQPGQKCRARLGKFLRPLALVLFFLTVAGETAGAAAAGGTNYFCIVCGKGPLYGQIWLHLRGPLCDDCHKLENRCSLCGLPVRDGGGSVKTGDGRFICKFDKTNAVLEVEAAREIFETARQDVVDLYGRNFLLKYPDVTVRLFDVDYWSEKGRTNGLDKYGFASTRRTPSGQCTHEVVLLSGQLRDEIIAVAAHEYTHLWISENRPDNRVIDPDTVEALCELTAYKLMQEKNLPAMQKKILENPYTHGKIKTLVEIEQRYNTDYMLDWVKNGRTETFEADAGFGVLASPLPVVERPYVPPLLPQTLKFSGLLTLGKDRMAVINGVAFAAGDEKKIKLRNKTVSVRCQEIQNAAVVLQLDESADRVILKKGEEKSPP